MASFTKLVSRVNYAPCSEAGEISAHCRNLQGGGFRDPHLFVTLIERGSASLVLCVALLLGWEVQVHVWREQVFLLDYCYYYYDSVALLYPPTSWPPPVSPPNPSEVHESRLPPRPPFIPTRRRPLALLCEPSPAPQGEWATHIRQPGYPTLRVWLEAWRRGGCVVMGARARWPTCRSTAALSQPSPHPPPPPPATPPHPATAPTPTPAPAPTTTRTRGQTTPHPSTPFARSNLLLQRQLLLPPRTADGPLPQSLPRSPADPSAHFSRRRLPPHTSSDRQGDGSTWRRPRFAPRRPHLDPLLGPGSGGTRCSLHTCSGLFRWNKSRRRRFSLSGS
jgi:hypothetical protein